MRIWKLVLIMAVSLLVCGSVAAAEQVRVKSVLIEGNERIEDDAIMRQVNTRPGSAYDEAVLSEDLSAIFKMGYFDDVRVEVEREEDGNTVIFTVEEKPTVRDISISGNQYIDDDEIKENLDVSTGSILNLYRINRNVEAIERLYRDKNYHNVKVAYEIEKLAHNQGNLRFIIEEGKKVRIRQITLEGNRAYDDKELKGYMKTSEKGFFSWLTSSGDLDEEVLAQDAMRINAFYLNEGYAEARVAEPEVEIREEGIYIRIKIDEGARFEIGDIGFEGDLIESREKLLATVGIDEQDWYNQDVIRNDVINLTDMYADQGYARAEVSPDIKKRKSEEVIDLNFRIKKNSPVYFEEIIIEGNTKTRDKVIRRELSVHERERYSSSALKRSIRNLYRLDYFENVDVQTLRGTSDDRMILKVDVEEKATGTFSFGAGYSAVDKLYVMGSIQERNFLGRGQNLELRVMTGGESRQFALSFTEPWLFDIPLSLGLTGYNWERDYDEYTRDSKGGRVQLGYPLADYTRGYISYELDVSEVSDVLPEYQGLAGLEEDEPYVQSSVTTSLVYDSRDRAINPTEGSRHRASLQYAGLGGDVGFAKATAEISRYFPLLWGTVFFLNGEGGYVEQTGGKDLPDWEKFYLGGINSLRGFDWRDVSSYELNESGDLIQVGGTKYVQFNAEFIFPIIPSAGFMGLVFYDTGNVYGEGESVDLGELRESAGFGIRWYSPLGPIRLERGYILDKQEGESSGRWEFSIGGSF